MNARKQSLFQLVFFHLIPDRFDQAYVREEKTHALVDSFSVICILPYDWRLSLFHIRPTFYINCCSGA